MAEIKKPITMHLTNWQKQMLQNFMNTPDRQTGIKVTIVNPQQWFLHLDSIPAQLQAGEFNLFLTDLQINHVTEAMGPRIKISAHGVLPEMVESGAIVFE